MAEPLRKLAENLNLKPKKVLQHQLKVQAVKSLTLSPLKK